MSSFPEKVQQGEEEKREPITGLQSFEDDLPPGLLLPRDKIILGGHDRSFRSEVAITESGLIATVAEDDFSLRIFALDGDGEPLRVCSVPGSMGAMKFQGFRGLAALGGDVIAVGATNIITTWCASFGALLDISPLSQSSDYEHVSAMATLGPGQFVVGISTGALVFFSHRDGRDLHEAGRGNKSHEYKIMDIAVHGDTIVTAAFIGPVVVWSASKRVRVAVLGGHNHPVQCAAVCARFIATGSRYGEIRLYEVGAGHAFVRMIMGTQNHWIEHVSFVAEDALMYVGSGSVTFTLLSSAKPVARLNIFLSTKSAAITPDARIVCASMDEVFICSPPAPVATAVKNHAAIVFPSSNSPTFAEEELLQAAMVEVLAGSRSAGDACRALFSKENCSRSIEEWASAHRLLMGAVERNEIPGLLHFEGANSFWSENLYMPSSYLELYEDDRSLVERFAREAERAGVISKAEAVLAAVLGRQDVLKNEPRLLVSSRPFASPSVSPPPKGILAQSRPGVTSMPERSSVTSMPKQPGVEPMPRTVHPSVLGGQDVSLKIVSKLHISGQKIASILWEVTARLAENDSEMRKLLTEVKSVDRHQKLNSLFNCVLSFELLGGNALAQGLAGADPVWSLLESIMGAGEVNQEGIAPTILDTFVGCAASLISPAGGSVLAAEDQVMFEKAVGALDISWEEFCGTIQKAAARRGVCTDASGGQPWSDQELASVCRQVVGDDFPFLLSELRTVCSSNNSRSASGERAWPFQSLFEQRGVSLMRWEAVPDGCEAVPEPEWLTAEQIDLGFVVKSSSGVEYFLFFKLRPLTECGLKFFLSLVPSCEKSLALLRVIKSEHRNCLLEELEVPFPSNGSHVDLAVHAGWLSYVRNPVKFAEEHVRTCVEEFIVVGVEGRTTGGSRVKQLLGKACEKARPFIRFSSTAAMSQATRQHAQDALATADTAPLIAPIAENLVMRDGSFFSVPVGKPNEEASVQPVLTFPPKTGVAFTSGQGTRTVRVGVQMGASASVEAMQAHTFDLRESFSREDLLRQQSMFSIRAASWLNDLVPITWNQNGPELDERVRVFSLSLSMYGNYNIDPKDISSCWYHAIRGPPEFSNEMSYPNIWEGSHAIKVEKLNFADYTVSKIDDARSYATNEGREDVSALLGLAGVDDAHVVFVHSNASDSSTVALKRTRLAFFLGPNTRGGVRCNLVKYLDPSQADGSLACPEFRPPRCDVSGEIGGTRPLSVSTIGERGLSQPP